MENSVSNVIVYNKFSLRHVLYTSLKHWYVFAVIIPLILFVKFYIIRYSVPVYQVKSSLYLRGDKKQHGGAENFISGLSILNNSKSIQNEMEVLNSYPLVLQTVGELEFEVSCFLYGNIKEEELYKRSPLTIQLDTSFANQQYIPFIVEIDNDKEFTIYKRVDGNVLFKRLTPTNIYNKEFICRGKFGELCESSFFRLRIFRSPNLTEDYKGDTKFYFRINNIHEVATGYQSRLKLELTSKYSNIINMSVTGTVPDKDIDFLNKLMETYIKNGLMEKNEIVTNTINFIDLQLMNLNDSLKGAESELQAFRSTGNIIDVESTSETALSKLNRLDEERDELLIQLRYYKYLQDYIASERDIKEVIAPSIAGINDLLLSKLVSELYELISEQNNLPFSARDKNPTYKLLELKINNTKAALNENILNLIKSTDLFLVENQKRINEVKTMLGELPQKEREMFNIQRKFKLSDNIYNYLLEKRIEASIAKAASVPDNKVMNRAILYGKISPNVAMISRISNLGMAILPFGIILLIMFTDNKVKSKEVLSTLSNISILGSVSHYVGDELIPVVVSPKSRLAESVRSLRINLQYILPGETSKVIGITSSISGEGKTFFSVNLAASIASTGNKVVIIGADMRKPRLQNHIQHENTTGLSSYLIRKNTLDEVLVNTSIDGLKCILSGTIPPNPAELMGTSRMEELMTDLKKRFDYIIIDSPPIILVADYFVLAKFVDAHIFLCRQNYTTIPMIKEIISLAESRKLQNSFWVLNDADEKSRYQYGYGYGYGNTYGYGYGSSGAGYGYYDDHNEAPLNRWVRRIKRMNPFKKK